MAIQKLDKFDSTEASIYHVEKLYAAVNQLVDAVNELQKHEEQHLDLLTQLNEMRLHQNKEPADQFAEERKWIGCFCRFRDKHSDVWEYGTLEAVEDVDHAIDSAFRSSDGYWYDICEPIKPDDDIIYKGGDNE